MVLVLYTALSAVLVWTVVYTYMVKGVYNYVTADPVPESAVELVKRAVSEKWAIYSLRSGLESLPQAMYTALLDRGVKVHLNQPCTALCFPSENSVQVCGERVPLSPLVYSL